MADLGGEYRFFEGIHVRIDIRIEISFNIKAITSKLASRYIYRI